MALNIKKQAEKLVELTVPYGDDEIKLKYRAGLITPNFLNGPESESEFCAAVIAEWDVTADGEAWPPTVENLNATEAELAYTLCYAIINHVKKSAALKLRA